MKSALLSLMLAIWSVAAASHAWGACNDGILSANEECDPGSPIGTAACPGRCIKPPNLAACRCADLSTDHRDFAIIADIVARVSAGGMVTGGGVAVRNTAGYLYLDSDAIISGSEQAAADRCRLQPGSSVGRLFCNDDVILPGAFIADGGPFDALVPLSFPTLPAFETAPAGGSDVTVSTSATEFLAPGTYATIVIEPNATLFLHGLSGGGVGRYNVGAFKVSGGGQLLADNPVVLNIKDSLKVSGASTVSPNPATSIQPGDFTINVEGRGARLGRGAFVQAHVRAPNGRIIVGRGTIAAGRLIGQRVVVNKGAGLFATGGCGDGTKQPTETCDTSAPNGDQACPGECIPVGQAGQCSCRCNNNAQCDDGNACNGLESCTNGHCSLGLPLQCNDNNPCTTDCNPTSGCVNAPKPNDTPCEDGNECTRDDVCLAGVCQAGSPRLCNDGSDCTTDSCVPTSGCVHVDLTGVACGDGNACTQGDACIRGRCVGGAAVGCDDQNPCTADTCDPLVGCKHGPVTDGISCAGSSPCSTLDTCAAGTCIGRGAVVCSDGNVCTIDLCTPTGTVPNQTTSCTHQTAANFTPCGANGLVCFNGVCQ